MDSRSQFALDGVDAMEAPLKLSIVLGVFLLLLAACGNLLYRRPSKAPAADLKAHGGMGYGHHEDSMSLQAQFEDSQREAMRKLSDSTPDDMKFTIYGLFKQAKEGNVKGDRPGVFNRRERSKYDAWARNRGMTREEAMDGY